MSRVVLSGHIKIPESELSVVMSALEEHKRLTLAEPGCLVFTVTPRTANPYVCDVYEVFSHQQAFNDHQHRVQNSMWGRITVNVERCYEMHSEEPEGE